MEDTFKTALLYSIYGEFITKKQQQIVEAYHFDDLSLSEIADNLGISKQAVSEQLNRATAKLFEYEKNLHILEDRRELEDKLDSILKDFNEAFDKTIIENGTKCRLLDKKDEKISEIKNKIEELKKRFRFFQE